MSLTSEEKQQKLDELNAFIQQHKDDKGALMPVMQKAQELFGYLSLEIQSVIAEALNVSVAEVYGVATFYAQFSQATRCLGCCGLAPVMTINEDVYGRLKPEDIPGILAKYKA